MKIGHLFYLVCMALKGQTSGVNFYVAIKEGRVTLEQQVAHTMQAWQHASIYILHQLYHPKLQL